MKSQSLEVFKKHADVALSGHDGVGLVIWLDDLRGLFLIFPMGLSLELEAGAVTMVLILWLLFLLCEERLPGMSPEHYHKHY